MLKSTSTILLAALAATAAQGQSASSAPSVRVHYSDLDLNSAAGVASLDRRIDAAIGRLCGRDRAPEPLSEMRQRMTCERSSRATAAPQRSAVLAAAQRGEAPVRLAIDLR